MISTRLPYILISRKIIRRRSLIILAMFGTGLVSFFGSGSVPGYTGDFLWLMIVSSVAMAGVFCLSVVPAFPELVDNAENIY